MTDGKFKLPLDDTSLAQIGTGDSWVIYLSTPLAPFSFRNLETNVGGIEL